MEQYDHLKIEKKWQKEWEKKKVYKTLSAKDAKKKGKKPFYVLDMFPYPSGAGLHVGHPRGYIGSDVLARMKRMQGYNVLHPMGYDAFGLPAEQYAIEHKIHPRKAVEENIKTFRGQLEKIGFSYDWSRAVNTTDPEYYKWTQWIFLKLYEKGLAYEAESEVNWCPKLGTVLANDEIVDGPNGEPVSERGGYPVEKKKLRQWFLKITAYADKLLEGLDDLNWPEHIKEIQRNWIGREEKNGKVTYKMRDAVFARQRYWGEPIPLRHVPAPKKQKALIIHGFEGSAHNDWMPWMKKQLEKSGIEVRIPTISTNMHPTLQSWMKELLPLVSDFTENDIVIGHSLGSCAALHLLAQANIRIRHLFLVASAIGSIEERNWGKFKEDYPESDISALRAFWSAPLDLSQAGSHAKKVTIILSDDDPVIPRSTHENLPTDWEFKLWSGFEHFNDTKIPKLRDEFLRAQQSEWIPVSESKLPLKLPNVKSYEPTGEAEGPLAGVSAWVKKGYETNTMPGWAGSSWYFLRYMDPKNKKALASKEELDYWRQVSVYVGGAEHATGHLLYARFWHKFLHDIGIVPTTEPFPLMHNQGLIMASDGRKMSKRWGNVINPDEIVKVYGADTLRVYEMFMGPFDDTIAWSTESIIGSRRFIEKVARVAEKIENKNGETSAENKKILHKTIAGVTGDINTFKFNTAISKMMICMTEFERDDTVSVSDFKLFLQLLAPFAPHVTEEIWRELGEKLSIHLSKWPEYDPKLIEDNVVTIAIQINGKTRGTINVARGSNEAEVAELAKKETQITKYLTAEIKKTIFVPDRLINFVV